MKKYIVVAILTFMIVPFPGKAQEKPFVDVTPCVISDDWKSAIICVHDKINFILNAIRKIENRIDALQQGKTYGIDNYGETMKKEVSESSGQVLPQVLPGEQTRFDKEKVKTIQNFLKADGVFKYPEATGNYGEITKEAVKQFQEKYGIPTSGKVDTQTFKKIQDLAPQVAPSLNTKIQKLGGSLLQNTGR